MNPRHNVLALFWLWSVAYGSAAPFQDTDYYQSVATSHYIRVEGEGLVDVPFAEARRLFEQDDILDAVQVAYRNLLPPGEQPEFTVQQEATNRWSYLNKANQRSVMVELHRSLDDADDARLVFYSEGERFFGDFRAVIDISVRGEDVQSRYAVTVMAYPVNSFSRFFARHLGVVPRFFRTKTTEITELAVMICRYLADERRADTEAETPPG